MLGIGDNQKYTLSRLWQKAVVAGTFWGAFEIVLGSSLHNLMIPLMAGTVLSFIGVLIISALSAQQIQRGLFWRAALVCALLKSVSPSAVILTPMLGIMLEGLCLEFGVLLIGSNVAGLLLGGGLAVFSVPAFRVVRLFLMYGSNISELYLTLFGNKQADAQVVDVSIWPIIGIALLYMLFGIVAAILGRSLGKTLNVNMVQYSVEDYSTEKIALKSISTAYKPIILFALHLVFLVAFIGFSSRIPTSLVLILATVYVVLCVTFYKRTRFLFKKFWLLISIILFSFVIPMFGAGSFTDLVWLDTGSRVFVRAIIVVVSFAAIGTELGKPCVGSLFSGGIFQPAYMAVSLAFSSLPASLEHLKDFRLRGVKPLQQLRNMLVSSIRSADNTASRYPVIIVCGERGEGKTSFIKSIVNSFCEQNIGFAGFYAQGYGSSSLRSEYRMKLLPNFTEHELCKRVGDCGAPNKSFIFNKQSISLGESVLRNAAIGDVIIVDEIGKLELDGLVWSDAITDVLKRNQNPVIIAVRKLFLRQVIEKWNISNPYIVDIDRGAADNVLNILSNSKLQANSAFLTEK